MKSVPVYDTEGNKTGEVQLKDYYFGCEINIPVMHLVVRRQLAAARRRGLRTDFACECVVPGPGR